MEIYVGITLISGFYVNGTLVKVIKNNLVLLIFTNNLPLCVVKTKIPN